MIHSAEDNREKADQTKAVYSTALRVLKQAEIPILIGGAYALRLYTGVHRETKDIDLFVLPEDFERVLEKLSAAGYHTSLFAPHWLGKAAYGDLQIDIIFSSGNAISRVDEEWFAHAVDGRVFDLDVQLIPPEEMIWSKAFVMERHRYDGADIMHLVLARGKGLDWQRLLRRFGEHWHLLLSYLVLFRFTYPSDRDLIPKWVMQDLLQRLQQELALSAPKVKICRGTLGSNFQYRIDVEKWGYRDARLLPGGNMTPEEIAHWAAEHDREYRREKLE